MNQRLFPLLAAALLIAPASTLACPLAKGGAPAAHMGGAHMGSGAMLANMDANKDGKVSKQEFDQAHQARMAEMFGYLDANGDGFITDEDKALRRQKHAEAAFDRADANHDGSISKDEFTAARSNRHGPRGDCPLSPGKP